MDEQYRPFLKAISINDLPEEAWTYLVGDSGGQVALQEFYQRVPWLFRGIDIRSNAVAAMPFGFYRGSNEIDTSDDYQNMTGVLPNPGALFGLVEAALAMWGYAYLFKQSNIFGVAKGLRYLFPPSVKAKIDEATGEPSFKRQEGSVIKPYTTDDIVYLWKPDPWVEVGPPSASPALAASSAAGVVLNVDKFAEAFFARGAIKTTLLTYEGPRPVEAEVSRLKAFWKKLTQGIDTSWKSEVFSDKIKPVVVGEGIESLHESELSEEKRMEIATAIGVPHSVLFSNAANFATAKVDDFHFYDKTIVPDCEFIAQQLNAQVFEKLGYALRFKPETLDVFQEDEAERAGSLEKLVNVLDKGPVAGVAMSILGYEIDPDIQAELEAIWKEPKPAPPPMFAPAQPSDEARDELRTWRKWATKRIKAGQSISREFETRHVQPVLAGAIAGALDSARTVKDIELAFNDTWSGYP